MIKYYNTNNIVAFPTSNSTDNGKLTLEENMSSIVTRITTRNYVLSSSDFVVTVDNSTLVVSEGKCNIAGFDIRTNASIILDPPETSPFDGHLAMKLTFDGSGHVRGDVEDGSTVLYTGVYLSYILESDIDEYTLVLGSVSWDGTTLEFKRNPDIEHKLDASDIGATVDIKTYDLNGDDEGTATTMNLQEYILNIPDWYVSKFGDFMIGDLIFNTGVYTYDNNSNTGEFSNLVNCGSISLANSSGTRGVEYISKSPANDNIFVKMQANSNMLSGISVSNGLGNVTTIGAVGDTNSAFEIRNSFSNKLSYISFRHDGGVDINGNNDITISGHSNNSNGNAYMKFLNDAISIFTVSDISSKIHEFSFDELTDGFYPIYRMNTFSINTKPDSYVELVNSGSTVNILPSVTTNNLYANNSIRVGSNTNNTTVSSSGFTTTYNNNIVSNLDRGSLLTSNYVGVSGSIPTLQNNAPNAILAIANGGVNSYLSLNNNTRTAIYFRNNGDSKVSLYNTGNNILNLEGNFKSSGTITGSKVYNAVYNDYAEWYERDNINEEIEPGDVIEINPDTGKYRKSTLHSSVYAIGVCSDSYGHIVGGDKLDNMEDNIKKYIPVGLCGRVYVKVYDRFNQIRPGDLLVSAPNGHAAKTDYEDKGKVIGKALDITRNGKVLMQIMLG